MKVAQPPWNTNEIPCAGLVCTCGSSGNVVPCEQFKLLDEFCFTMISVVNIVLDLPLPDGSNGFERSWTHGQVL